MREDRDMDGHGCLLPFDTDDPAFHVSSEDIDETWIAIRFAPVGVLAGED